MGIFLGLIGLTICMPSHSAVQAEESAFPDTPKNHWVYEAMSDLKSTGLLIGYPDGLGFRRNNDRSRYELAVATNAAFVRAHDMVSGLAQMRESISQRPADAPGAIKDLADWDSEVKFYKKGFVRQQKEILDLIATFSPQLSKLGVDPAEMTGRLKRDSTDFLTMRRPKPGEALEQFPDVPTGHWAAGATQNLRSLGILHGYPDGQFRG